MHSIYTCSYLKLNLAYVYPCFQIKHFQRQRVQEIKECVERYAAFQLASAKTSLNTLSLAFNQIKAINL